MNVWQTTGLILVALLAAGAINNLYQRVETLERELARLRDRMFEIENKHGFE